MSDDPTMNAAVGQRETAATPEKPTSSKTPERWWQWLFLYPVFGLALLGAVPNWAGSAKEFFMELNGRPLQVAEEQRSILNSNLECLRAPYIWREVEGGVMVDATMCPATTDILLRYRSPDGQEGMYGIDLDKLLFEQTADAGFSLISPAYAATPLPPVLMSPVPGNITLAQEPLAIVQCVDQVDDRTIVRHVSVGAICFDETLDTLTGLITAKLPVPCKATC